jgi:nitroreductase
MDLFEAIDKRHSYRGGYKDIPVPRADLVRIVQAGIQAPSACNEQTTSFVIVDDASLLAQLGDLMDRPVVRQAKAIILCLADHRPVYQGISFAAGDCAAAVENMLLAVTALGYATVWIDGALRREGRAERIAAMLGLPSNLRVSVMLPIGVPETAVTQREKKPFAARAWFNTERISSF